MPPVGFEPTVSAGERPQTYALDRAATGISKGEICQDNIQACGLLFNINAMVYFKFNLQLKFRNKSDSSVSVNFHAGLAEEYGYIDVKLNVRGLII